MSMAQRLAGMSVNSPLMPELLPGLSSSASPAAHVLTCVIQSIRFHAQESGYSVLSVMDSHSLMTHTAVGTLVNPREGDEYQLTGKHTTHPKHGPQYTFTEAVFIPPTTHDGLVAYLSDITYGVGPVKAAKIVEALGAECLDIIQGNAHSLDNLTFLTDTQRTEIRAHLTEHRILAELTSLICKVPGVTPRLAARIYAKYGPAAVDVVTATPYILADDMYNVGFKTADKVAMALDIPVDSPMRIQSAIEYVISEATNEGHCFLRPRGISQRVRTLLPEIKVTEKFIGEAAAALIGLGRLVREDYVDAEGQKRSAIYVSRLYGAETRLAGKIRELLTSPLNPNDFRRNVLDDAELMPILSKVEGLIGITYNDVQREAIRTALTSRFSIITGGPGTGKTTVTRSITEVHYELSAAPIYLASPTGRAAKRLASATGMEARTIHRLLQYHPEFGFRVNSDEPLGPGLLIVDEASMLDVELAAHLMDAITPDMQVVFVGDADQLPSVGPGSVLRDLIASGVIPVTRLAFVYRQAAGSEIHSWADDIKHGRCPDLKSGQDVKVFLVDDGIAAAEKIRELAVGAHDKGIPVMDVQFLSPVYKAESGVNALNAAVREVFNPVKQGGVSSMDSTYEGSREGTSAVREWHGFRVGDKVLVTKNSYALEVFNGDLGIVTSVNPQESLLVMDVDGSEVTVDQDNIGIIKLAYCTTIHKSQGGEYPYVVLAVTRQHYMLLTREVIYTAITRARKRLMVVADEWALRHAIRNDRAQERYSRLGERLRSAGP